ncbi:hypothetical protein O0L34_g9349 [Tuta absoluta]|nr:hypothetical protein O0L34_g9349 [Tuta absoluta]
MFLKNGGIFRIRGQPLSAVWGCGNDSFKIIASDISRQSRFYSKKGDEEDQTKGREVDQWPKPVQESHTLWKADCPTGPPPPNLDPYRIKVPEVVVPPLPQPCAKWHGILMFQQPDRQGQGQQQQDMAGPFQNPYYGQPYGQPFPQKKPGLMDKLKGLFGLGKKTGRSDGQYPPNQFQIVSV